MTSFWPCHARLAPAALLAGASVQFAPAARADAMPADTGEHLEVQGETHGVVPQASSSGTKTSTPLPETPQSISVVT